MNLRDHYVEKPIKLFFHADSPLMELPSLYADYFCEITDRDNADFVVLESNYSDLHEIDLNDIEKMVVFLRPTVAERNPKPNHIRRGKLVDELGLGEERSSMLARAAVVFTNADLDYDKYNFVSVPLAFNLPRNISQPKLYWQNDLKVSGQRKRSIYWSGTISTHESRVIINKLNQYRDDSFNFNAWNPKSVDGNDAAVYGKKTKPRPQEYENFIKQLIESEAFLVIRGDRPWVFSFLDVIRAGCIPCLIDTGYDSLGWNYLGYEVSDLFLSFNVSKDNPDAIRTALRAFLDDEQKRKLMRQNIVSFYRRFIKTDRYYVNGLYHPWLTGWGDFYAAKLIERMQGNLDNKFFSKTVLGLKKMA